MPRAGWRQFTKLTLCAGLSSVSIVGCLSKYLACCCLAKGLEPPSNSAQLKPDKKYFDPEILALQLPPLVKTSNLTAQQVIQLRRDIDNFTTALQKRPLDASLYAQRAVAYMRLNRREAAASDVEKALRLSPGNQLAASVAYTIAVRYHQDLEEEQELKFLNLTIKACPNQSHLYRERGDLLHGLDREKEALADQNKAILLNPKNNGGYQGRAQIESLAGKMDAAIKDFSRAVELYPYSQTSIMALSQCYEAEKKYPQAIDGYSRMLANPTIDPVDRMKTRERRAELFYKMGKVEDALKDYTAVIETPRKVFKTIERSTQFSGYSRALQGRAALRQEQKKYELAISDYTALIQFEKDWGDFDPKWYHERAKLYRLVGKQDLAAADEKLEKR